MTLIEVLIALAILGVVAVTYLSALEMFYARTVISQERTTAEDLAKSQLEYVNVQDYDDAHNPPQYEKLTGVPVDYFIDLNPVRLDPKQDGTGNDDGMQKIAVSIYKGSDASGRLLLTVQGYKLTP
jgi:prepilin-type N-terminal cleavage/methylation domain-containing protein